MFRCMLKAMGALALGATSLSAAAFEAVDVLTPSTSGRYPAYAEEPPPPYGFWAQAGVMYDTNALRLTAGDNKERIARFGAGARAEQRIAGRQRLYLEGRADAYRYDRYRELDYTGWAGLGEWRYEIGNDLSGAIGLSARRFQASLAELRAPVADEITEKRGSATAAYRLGANARLRGGFEHLRYERPTRRVAETRTNAFTLGADYVTPIGNAVGLEWREARGDAPVSEAILPGTGVENDYRQRDLALTATWAASPFIRIGGRAGYTQREYTEVPGRDFSGPTWRLTLDWLPGAKTVLTFETYRSIASLVDVAASHMLIEGFSFGPSWAPTAKLNFSARFLREEQSFEGDASVPLLATPERQEIVRAIRLGTYWELTRNWHFQFAYDTGERESNILGRNFRYNAGVANVRFVW